MFPGLALHLKQRYRFLMQNIHETQQEMPPFPWSPVPARSLKLSPAETAAFHP